ncbi:hypothetical protein COCSUDRAFT_33313 [Coccomyxa subellipsoidea C-169]|uniref:Uncharacterized protein n=1 Tax=Coccomyxa subellipsoidea (strain C-169) TaxID=574566 RepID=I0YVX9_COCSC|nr:hypothetical protein COCSUDRAFT_33313 [Coccomyxa subellipsoidea C-169]EIE22548.1 hypothetical protein COCSUDRAFT_33313 [Coccomyxa subellipsoidea C-169]|eukprot:XP_005647092.1 hypothetical protein COCSUDRAFT_33313 [Coccomyxa subellipsoidea C-169]
MHSLIATARIDWPEHRSVNMYTLRSSQDPAFLDVLLSNGSSRLVTHTYTGKDTS